MTPLARLQGLAAILREPGSYRREYALSVISTLRSAISEIIKEMETVPAASAGDESATLYADPRRPADAREAIIEELAVDFENSVHHVWDNQEVADRLRDLAHSRPHRGGAAK